MKNIFIDTDVLISYSKGRSPELRALIDAQAAETILYINPVVIAEFMTDKNLEQTEIYNQAIELIALFSVKDITVEVGKIAGELRRKGLVNYLGDALIAATCLFYHLNLYTKNLKDFHKVPSLNLFQPAQK